MTEGNSNGIPSRRYPFDPFYFGVFYSWSMASNGERRWLSGLVSLLQEAQGKPALNTPAAVQGIGYG